MDTTQKRLKKTRNLHCLIIEECDCLDFKALLKDLKNMKAKGDAVDPIQYEELKKREASFQVDYTPDYECAYKGGQYINTKSNEPLPAEIINAIEGRVKMLKPTLPSSVDKLIEKLEGMEGGLLS